MPRFCFNDCLDRSKFIFCEGIEGDRFRFTSELALEPKLRRSRLDPRLSLGSSVGGYGSRHTESQVQDVSLPSFVR